MPGVPHGVMRKFSAGDVGLYTRGLYMKIFIMHFNAQTASPGLYIRGQKRKIAKKIIFLQPKMGFIHQGGGGGVYTCGGCRPGLTVYPGLCRSRL